MARTPRCPRCGETQRLRGRQVDTQVVIACAACGHSWDRGTRPCATCGGTEVVDRPQTMTRNPRGNQLAVIGTRTIRLCTECDRAVVERSLALNDPVTEGYVAAYQADRRQADVVPEQAPVIPPPTPVDPVPPLERAEPSVPPSSVPQRAAAPKPDLGAPTVRQAVAAALESGVDADVTAVLLFSTHLGPSTRVRELDTPARRAALREWFTHTWPDRGSDQYARAVGAVRAVGSHWHQRGWVNSDPERWVD